MSQVLKLKRISDHPKGLSGVLFIENLPAFVTLENPNTQYRIPVGKYVCKKVISPRFGETFTVLTTDGHDLLRFHSGNTEADTDGCILIASSFGHIGNAPCILESKKGFAKFLSEMYSVENFTLEISDLCQ